jgi:acyl carrier protein
MPVTSIPPQHQRIIEMITPIFREVFEDAQLNVTPDLNAQMVKNWDSLNHITLIVELEQAAGVQFSTDELVAMVDVGSLIECLARKGVCA